MKLKDERDTPTVIICICRGKSEKDVMRSIDNGANSIRDLQRCGIGDQCGSCHNALRTMLAQSAAAQPCPACMPAAVAASASASA